MLRLMVALAFLWACETKRQACLRAGGEWRAYDCQPVCTYLDPATGLLSPVWTMGSIPTCSEQCLHRCVLTSSSRSR